MVLEVVQHALMITSFVFVMMLVIEYVNVLTGGNWEQAVRRRRLAQPFLCSLLGVTPGCLGAFAVVSLYAHKVISFGAVVAGMVATCGDEAFVMLAMFPRQAAVLLAVLFAVGVVSGIVVDIVLKGRGTRQSRALDQYESFHRDEEACVVLPRRELLQEWRHCSAQRGILTISLALFVLGVVSGDISHEAGGWIRITLVLSGVVGLFIVTTVSEHFLETHLWNHLVKVHIARIFLWTLGALLLLHLLIEHLEMEALIRDNPLQVLLVACLVGIIPESGPHLIFVTLYAEGAIPFSVLLAGSIVQDGHGMIPMLAHSRRAFLAVKAVNFVIGLTLGLLGFWMGW